MGGHAHYSRRLSDLDVIGLFDAGLYSADLDAGVVYNRRGREVASYVGNDEGHLFIRLYGHGGCRAVALHRVIWIVGARSSIPEGWEVHHYDLDTSNSAFVNLYCLHPVDHRKLHGGRLILEADPDEVPF